MFVFMGSPYIPGAVKGRTQRLAFRGCWRRLVGLLFAGRFRLSATGQAARIIWSIVVAAVGTATAVIAAGPGLVSRGRECGCRVFFMGVFNS
jgi:hypothetical protein